MKKINFFHKDSVFHPFRWFLVVFIGIAGLMTYADLTGMRLFAPNTQQQWNARGAGYHK